MILISGGTALSQQKRQKIILLRINSIINVKCLSYIFKVVETSIIKNRRRLTQLIFTNLHFDL